MSKRKMRPVARFTKHSYDISYLMLETTLRVTCDLSNGKTCLMIEVVTCS